MKSYFSIGFWRCFVIGIYFILLSGCKKEEKCEGCDKDAPWSNIEAPYCYPTENQCEDETGYDCERCD